MLYIGYNNNARKIFMWLYKHYDKDMNILYIGMTINLFNRHLATKHGRWVKNINFIEIEKFDNFDDLKKAEKEAILKHRPINNYRHNPDNSGKGITYYFPVGVKVDYRQNKKERCEVFIKNEFGEVIYQQKNLIEKEACEIADKKMLELFNDDRFLNKKKGYY